MYKPTDWGAHTKLEEKSIAGGGGVKKKRHQSSGQSEEGAPMAKVMRVLFVPDPGFANSEGLPYTRITLPLPPSRFINQKQPAEGKKRNQVSP